MSGLHTMYSLGALMGAVLGAFFIRSGLTPKEHFAGLLVMTLLLTSGFIRGLPSERDAASRMDNVQSLERRTWSLPLVALGILAACAAIPEGAVADWVGVYLKETVHSPEGVEALGFAAFSLTMLVGRPFGDRLSEMWGPVRVAQLGSSIAAMGLVLAFGLPSVTPVIGGVAFMGLGISVLAPLAFSAVGRVAPDNTCSAVAVVTAFFYLGYLAGPPVIGALAHLSSLRVGLLFLLLAALIAALLSPILGGNLNPELTTSRSSKAD